MMEIFNQYDWPGNIRQLRNVVLTSLVFGSGDVLSLADVSWLFDELQPCGQQVSDGSGKICKAEQFGRGNIGGVSLVELEREAILATLEQTSGNRSKAAKVLGISDRTLRDKMKRYREEGCLQQV